MESWSPTPQFWEENENNCMNHLKETWDQIPVLNYMSDDSLSHGKFVRFRGMIQDMFSPVYFMKQYEVINVNSKESTIKSGKFQDSISCQEEEEVIFDSLQQVNGERRPMYCISIPCLNSWVDQSCQQFFSPVSKTEEKMTAPSISKRAVDEMEVDSNEIRVSEAPKVTKRQCTTAAVSSGENSATENVDIDLNLPLANPKSKACILNFYDNLDANIKLNDIVEVVGFLSNDPLQHLNEDPGNDEFDIGDSVFKLPPSIVPRIHVVSLKHLKDSNLIPTLTPSVAEIIAQDTKRLRNELKFVLSQLMLGDSLAAEYLICHLVSAVFLRQDLTVLGHFPLNISNLPIQACPNYSNLVYQVLESLLLKSHFFQMSIPSMNKTTMIPKKDYATNRLVSGMLQLSSGTHLVLDETKFEAGLLRNEGVHNVTALSNIIKNQKMNYNFQFYDLDIDTDLPILVLSEGKSMLNCNYQVKLEPEPSSVKLVQEIITSLKRYLQQHIDELRAYILCIKSVEYELTSEMSQQIQSDFVKLRQERGNQVSPDDLHALLIIGRLYAISNGQRSLDPDSWNQVLEMEESRRSRLNSSR